jgi:hypothetical protein
VSKKIAYREKEAGRWVPCSTCLFLINNQVCPFVRCVRIDGWAVSANVKLEHEKQ